MWILQENMLDTMSRRAIYEGGWTFPPKSQDFVQIAIGVCMHASLLHQKKKIASSSATRPDDRFGSCVFSSGSSGGPGQESGPKADAYIFQNAKQPGFQNKQNPGLASPPVHLPKPWLPRTFHQYIHAPNDPGPEPARAEPPGARGPRPRCDRIESCGRGGRGRDGETLGVGPRDE